MVAPVAHDGVTTMADNIDAMDRLRVAIENHHKRPLNGKQPRRAG